VSKSPKGKSKAAIIKGLKALVEKAEAGGDIPFVELLRVFGKVDELAPMRPTAPVAKRPDGYCRKFKHLAYGCATPCQPHQGEVPECSKCLWWEASSVARMERVKEGHA